MHTILSQPPPALLPRPPTQTLSSPNFCAVLFLQALFIRGSACHRNSAQQLQG
ncbi:hypothetical protein BgiMline_009118, partial [Biomphalaria glabrata]